MASGKRLFTSRELAMCGLFGAAGLLLPVLFHALHLGHIFMPMYLPLLALGFFVSPAPAALTALVVPLLSGVVTGMPPFYPPVAVLMAIELSIMAALLALACKKRPKLNEWLVLIPVLFIGRILYVAMIYGVSLVIELPAAFVAGASFISGWPGLILMMIVIPPLARLAKSRNYQA